MRSVTAKKIQSEHNYAALSQLRVQQSKTPATTAFLEHVRAYRRQTGSTTKIEVEMNRAEYMKIVEERGLERGIAQFELGGCVCKPAPLDS